MASTFRNPRFFRNAEGGVYESYSGAPYSATDTPLTHAEGAAAQREEAKTHLRKLLKPGSTVYCILNHVSSSGMSRSISLAIGGKKGEIVKLDYWVAKARGEHIDPKHGGLRVSGCGMDMGFHLVYGLASILYPKGSRKGRGGKPDKDGGYSLNSTWL